MTSPHVSLGNIGMDIGSGANSFASGLVAQRQRQQQIAMQEGLNASRQALEGAQAGQANAMANQANAQAGHLTAEIGGVQAQSRDAIAQAAGREHENMPADAGDEALFMKWAGPMKPGFFQGKTKKEADELIKAAGIAHNAGLRIQMTGNRNEDLEENALRTAYMGETGKIKTGLDNYRETLNAFSQAVHTDNPVAGEGMLLSWLKQRTNRMNQTELNRVAQLGGVENIAHRAISHIAGGVPMDPEMLHSFLDAATPGGIAHYNDYQALRHNYTSLALRKGYNPRNIVVDDDYGADIPQLEQAIGLDINGKPLPTQVKPNVRPQGLP